MATIKPNGTPCFTPVLHEARLTEMHARAAKVWRGETTPKAQCAADVLYLVAEVRSLRAQLHSKTGKSVEEAAAELEFEALVKELSSVDAMSAEPSRTERTIGEEAAIHRRHTKTADGKALVIPTSLWAKIKKALGTV